MTGLRTTATKEQNLPLAISAATLAACLIALLSGFLEAILELADSIDALADPSLYTVGFYIGLVAMSLTLIVCPLLFVTVGLPLYALLLRLRWIGPWHFFVIGFGVSCVTSVAAFFIIPIDRELAVSLVVVGGTCAALTFWYVARPDRTIGEQAS